ncbi:hypothetical protein ACIO3O_36985 [Streptomyces sp. NPDC087440]|uniref:hypothetical protein n=1 Tax=Streptomyces sp. NPDC087440 TaxID=3365790 RepID=UPI003810472D
MDTLPTAPSCFPLADYATATAHALGPDWDSIDGFLGASGKVFTRDGAVSLRLALDYDDDLTLEGHDAVGEVSWTLYIEHRPGARATTAQGLAEWGKTTAAFISQRIRRIAPDDHPALSDQA